MQKKKREVKGNGCEKKNNKIYSYGPRRSLGVHVGGAVLHR